MRTRSRGFVFRWNTLAAALLAASLVFANGPTPAEPPKTRTDNVTETLHGVTITDPYRWLEDQESPETRAWIDEQNKYTRGFLDAQPGRDALRARLAEMARIDSMGTPRERGGNYFFSKRLASQSLSVIAMRKGINGKDEVLIDPHPLSADNSISVGTAAISHDGSLLAYNIRRGGEDETEIRIFDVKTRKDRLDVFPRARQGSVTFLHDNSGLYYSRLTKEGSRVFFHKLGTDPAGDREIFGQGYPQNVGVSPAISEDGRYLYLFASLGSAGDRTEIFLKDLTTDAEPVTVVKDVAARFSPDDANGKLYIQTNWKAPKGRILVTERKNPGALETWREIVPESDAVIAWSGTAGDKLLVGYTRNAVSQVKILDLEGKFVRELKLPTLGSVGGLVKRWGSNESFYTFSSFVVPSTIYRYDLAKGTQEIWWRSKAPVRSEDFEVKQVWFESKDKTKVPMFVVHKKGLKLDGSNPTLLTGYGGFNISMMPGFSQTATAWAELGGVYAVPNLRGGGEFGEEWHKAGMLEKKQNVYDDFIAAAEWLIRNKYTSPKRLAISGGSNGGLLVGAVMTQRPELYQAVICNYPLLDMVRYHKFSIARFWVPEYGSAENPEQFKFIHAYSPYHNVKPGTKYPAVMFVTGDADTRVVPLHARKMAALMQASNGSGRPTLLRYNVKAGHAGGAPVEQQIEDNLDALTFLRWQLGVNPAK